MTKRRQVRKQRQRDDRLRQQAQALALDKQIFLDELATAAAKHRSGANPKTFRVAPVAAVGPATVDAAVSTAAMESKGSSEASLLLPTATLFHYYDKRLPVRHAVVPANGKVDFEEAVELTASEAEIMGPLLSRTGLPTQSCPPRVAHCHIKSQFLMCTRHCAEDNSFISQVAEDEHRMKQEGIRNSRESSTCVVMCLTNNMHACMHATHTHLRYQKTLFGFVSLSCHTRPPFRAATSKLDVLPDCVYLCISPSLLHVTRRDAT